jgi:hypothetical protein
MARRAIEYDSAHAYPEALQYYQRATALLGQALQSTPPPPPHLHTPPIPTPSRSRLASLR